MGNAHDLKAATSCSIVVQYVNDPKLELNSGGCYKWYIFSLINE